MLDTARPEVLFAIDAVREAALLTAQVQTELAGAALEKADRSPVTVADFASQALIGCLLEQAFSEAALVGEEDASALREDGNAAMLDQVVGYVGQVLAYSTPETVCGWIDHGNGEPGGRFWTLDPIDGTKGFLRGEQFAVALALIEDGVVQLGVLGCPNLREGRYLDGSGTGSLTVAVRGEGAWYSPLTGDEHWKAMQVSECASAADAVMLRSAEAAHTNTGQIGKFVEVCGVKAEPLGLDSQAKYSVLGAGAGDLLLRLLSSKQPDYRERIWDQAAGSIVVEESGGRITDLRGKALDFSAGRTLARNRGVVASNGYLHDAALAALDAIGAVPDE
jgi:HAL2 family 3'(2'),5'-bisphosphate nucleotidase